MIELLDATTAAERRRLLIGAPILGVVLGGLAAAVSSGDGAYRLAVGAGIALVLTVVVLGVGLRNAGGAWAKRPLIRLLAERPESVTRWHATKLVYGGRHLHTQVEIGTADGASESLVLLAEAGTAMEDVLRRLAPQAERR